MFTYSLGEHQQGSAISDLYESRHGYNPAGHQPRAQVNLESRANLRVTSQPKDTQNKSFKYRSNLTRISFKPSNNDNIECSRIFIRQITPTLILFPYKLFIFPDHSSPCKLLYYGCGTCVGGRSYSSTTDNLLDFYTIKTEQHLQT